MATAIAISGKGGSGKTTLAAMIIRALLGQAPRGILAVDADPNSCLGLTMGVELTGTVAEIREGARQKQPDNGGMDRVRTFEYGLQQAITEAKGFDLLTMGRPEGPDCYCAVNNLLRKFLDKLGDAYSFVVIDNEAGMEHLSRRTTNNVDVMCITAESSPIGVVTAQRIARLAEELPIDVKRIGVVWNRTEKARELDGIESFGCVPYDQALFEASMQAKNIFDLQENSPAFSAVQKILEQKLNIGSKK
ncbi:MAG TPA: AAA family ATPase [Sedimentisphaerales bacterium]|nr:AAA family ATPase [Sedimentisphaerales bacterium]